jgi:hypothetical protein
MAACEAHTEAYRKTHLWENGIDDELFSQLERHCKQRRLTDPPASIPLGNLLRSIRCL